MLKEIISGCTIIGIMGLGSIDVSANPTVEALERHVYDVTYHYASLVMSDTLEDALYGCAMLGYQRDRTVAVHRLSDRDQRIELLRQTNRCVCYSNFINDTYAYQVPEEVRNDRMLIELIVSALFIEMESHNRHFYEFDTSPYLSEVSKFHIAYNTKNQCTKNYEVP